MSDLWAHWRERLRSHSPATIDAPELSRAAVAVVVAPRADEIKLLFIKRAEHEGDPWSGHMAFPGGRVEEADSGALEAALRETCEEVHVDLAAKAELVGQLDDVRAVARGRRMPLVITPFVFELAEAVEPRANHEVEEILWVSSAALRDEERWSYMPYEFEGRSYELPCVRVSDRVIWGLTFRMLLSFFEVLEWPTPADPRLALFVRAAERA